MRGLRPIWVASALLLLACLVGIQITALPIRATAAIEMIQVDVQAVAEDCANCDMPGMDAGTCQAICAPASAVDSGIATDLATSSSRLWPSDEIAMSGRVVRPSLAPPRTS